VAPVAGRPTRFIVYGDFGLTNAVSLPMLKREVTALTHDAIVHNGRVVEACVLGVQTRQRQTQSGLSCRIGENSLSEGSRLAWVDVRCDFHDWLLSHIHPWILFCITLAFPPLPCTATPGDFAYDMWQQNATMGDAWLAQIEPLAARMPYMVSGRMRVGQACLIVVHITIMSRSLSVGYILMQSTAALFFLQIRALFCYSAG
jgi:hypothetical protein